MTRPRAPGVLDSVVLSAAIGYGPEQVASFLASLRRSGYRGDVVLLVEARQKAAFEALPLFAGVRVLAAPQWLPLRYPALQRPGPQRWIWHPLQAALWLCLRLLRRFPLPAALRRRWQLALGVHLYAPTEARFLHFYRFLLEYPYARVLLSDVRDVLFQTDPFRALSDVRGLAVSLEPRRYCIGTEPWNADRVREIYGAAMLARVAAQPVSCSGVTYGEGAAMREYLRLMTDEILALGRRMARRGWFDQALHNVILWTRWPGPLRLLETLASPVATLGSVPEHELRSDATGRLLNADGAVISVLHQYDRHRSLQERLLPALAGERITTVRPVTAAGSS
jgi:hypothetical protein